MSINGKAFEYACLITLRERLGHQNVIIRDDRPYITAQSAYNRIETQLRENMMLAAQAAYRIIFVLEPQIYNNRHNDPIILSLQSDAKGIAGDVRDLLCIRQQDRWEIGISCKHNHKALKHSRLSQTIDFGNEWFGLGCSEEYFDDIEPLFEELNQLHNDGAMWGDVENKAERFYVPVLNAFISELIRLYEIHGQIIPYALLSYLIGRHDFYKVISQINTRNTQVQAFNIRGSLNRNWRDTRTVSLNRTPLPTRIHHVDFKPGSNTTIEITCDNGWAVSLRLHSAESQVIPSLKFDVNFIGVPSNLYRHDEPW